MYIPENISMQLPGGQFSLDNIGRSSAQVMIFDDRVLKVENDCNVSANEAAMMRWLDGRLMVPKVIETACEEGLRYLLMSRIYGKYLCDDAVLDDQDLLAYLVAEGLRSLWAVDVSSCPTDRSLNAKFIEIEEGLRSGAITLDSARQDETYGPGGFASPAELFDWLVKNRPAEELVLSHGDFCLPNIFCDGKKLTGIIDLGYAGAADKWVDIEKVVWSMWANTTGQFGGKKRPFDRQKLFDTLKMEPDEERLRYYSLLSELC